MAKAKAADQIRTKAKSEKATEKKKEKLKKIQSHNVYNIVGGVLRDIVLSVEDGDQNVLH